MAPTEEGQSFRIVKLLTFLTLELVFYDFFVHLVVNLKMCKFHQYKV